MSGADPLLFSAFAEHWLLTAFIAFARLGSATLLLPGFGEQAIPPRVKIAFGLVLTLALMPILPIPEPPAALPLFVLLIGLEVMIGIFIGLGARLLLAALHILGAQIGFAAGLSNAFMPNQSNAESGSAIAALLMAGAVALLFATNLHHVILSGLLRSYVILPPGRIIPGDMADQVARLGAGAFYIAATMAAPFFLLSLLVNLGLGVANRVMPAMQVFFVAAPGLIVLGLGVLALTIPALLDLQIEAIADWYRTFVR
ncbi:flagellar biosynthetic protein FliR [Sulfitobacter aestuarii]|uniref:Flagellar biosynthetic protein FliR n=1 Tax=Sulfitobacter aestuarii TaxID=2161676 RepID=A0ABW5U112_9RHOB